MPSACACAVRELSARMHLVAAVGVEPGRPYMAGLAVATEIGHLVIIAALRA